MEEARTRLNASIITGAMLVAVLWVMVGEQVNEMQLAGWIGTTNIPGLHLPGWTGTWFSVFGNVETFAAQVLELMGQLDAQPCVNQSSYFDADFFERMATFRADHGEREICGTVAYSMGTVFAMNSTTVPRRGVKDFLADYREAHAEGDDAWPIW